MNNVAEWLPYLPKVPRTPPSYRKCALQFEWFGLRRGSRSWREYERGKALLRDSCVDDEDYEYHIKCLVDYLEV